MKTDAVTRAAKRAADKAKAAQAVVSRTVIDMQSAFAAYSRAGARTANSSWVKYIKARNAHWDAQKDAKEAVAKAKAAQSVADKIAA